MPVNSEPDKDTGRYYCSECFSFTIEEQLRLSGDDYAFYEDGTIFVEDRGLLEPEVKNLQEETQGELACREKEEDSNEQF